MQTSAFHAEAGFRERIAERRLLTLSRPSGEVFYRHEVYRKPVFTVPPKNGGLERAPECQLPGPKRTLHGYVAYYRS